MNTATFKALVVRLETLSLLTMTYSNHVKCQWRMVMKLYRHHLCKGPTAAFVRFTVSVCIFLFSRFVACSTFGELLVMGTEYELTDLNSAIATLSSQSALIINYCCSLFNQIRLSRQLTGLEVHKHCYARYTVTTLPWFSSMSRLWGPESLSPC